MIQSSPATGTKASRPGRGRSELEEARALGQTRTYSGYGVMVLDKDVDEELLFSVVQSIKIKGKVICPQSVKAHYGLK